MMHNHSDNKSQNDNNYHDNNNHNNDNNINKILLDLADSDPI